MLAGTGTTVAVTAVGGGAEQPEPVVIIVREDVDETKGDGRTDVGHDCAGLEISDTSV